MTSVLIQLLLMGINLFAAKSQQENGRNPGFQYFVAGFCCMGAVNALVRLLS
jgi:hypothetical protein